MRPFKHLEALMLCFCYAAKLTGGIAHRKEIITLVQLNVM